VKQIKNKRRFTIIIRSQNNELKKTFYRQHSATSQTITNFTLTAEKINTPEKNLPNKNKNLPKLTTHVTPIA
jgi:hypothetical protein